MSNVLDLFRLDRRVALVTGGGTGLGRAMALALASAGADVAVVGRRREPLETTVAALRALGRQGVAFTTDLSDLEALDDLPDQIERSLGPIEILVNNAGAIHRSPALDVALPEWDAIVRINLTSVFRLSQVVGRAMLDRGRGKIINVASALSFQGGIRVAAYAASKSGVAGLTRTLANEWAGRGVNVNAIAPGYMETDLTAALQQDGARYAEILARIPAGRWGVPDDLAGAVVFLASDASRYVHGTILVVDGGWLAR
ncbi:MAG: SDR family oxidoreductase [Armatimonadota bacterium]|nr:SDR family oxidoreductase [Armatimonadota bacterium]